LILINCSVVLSQNIDDLTFGTDTTLEIVTWNVENFPKNGQTTINYLKQVIQSIDADIIAFQEITDTTLFKQMIIDLPDYQYYIQSSWYGGLAYIYKTSTIQVIANYEIYTTSPYWSPFPRAPQVMEFTFMNMNFIVINNHLKCCGDGVLNLNNPDDEENRRYIANNLLREYINTNYTNNKVMVMGDFNDEITDLQENNVFQQILNDSENFLFADIEIANGSNSDWSYPTYPSHLDHILITNELFTEFETNGSEIRTIKIDEYLAGGWNEYENNISDHRPVGIKILPDLSANIDKIDKSKISFSNYPNPFSNTTTFCFDEIIENSIIEIYNSFGNKVHTIYLTQGQTFVTWNARDNQTGIYFVKYISDGKTIANTKIMIIK